MKYSDRPFAHAAARAAVRTLLWASSWPV